jgi:hypothetical protein
MVKSDELWTKQNNSASVTQVRDEMSELPSDKDLKRNVKEMSKFKCFKEGGAYPMETLLEIEDGDDDEVLRGEGIKMLIRKVEILMNKRPSTLLRHKKTYAKIVIYLNEFFPSQKCAKKVREKKRKKREKAKRLQRANVANREVELKRAEAHAKMKKMNKRTSLLLGTAGAASRRNEIHHTKLLAKGATARLQERGEGHFPALGSASSSAPDALHLPAENAFRLRRSKKQAGSLGARANKRAAKSSGLPRLPLPPTSILDILRPKHRKSSEDATGWPALL